MDTIGNETARENKKALSETQKAYLAGLFDGEGNIYIADYEVDAKRGDKVWRYRRYRTMVQLGNSDPRLIALWKNYYGGVLHNQKRHKPHYKHYVIWSITGERVIGVLKDILPYLIGKKKPAQAALEFQISMQEYRKQCRVLRKPFILTDIEKQRRATFVKEFKEKYSRRGG